MGPLRTGFCGPSGMPTDEHYNEPGGVPEPLEDHEPTDMPATVNMFVVIGALALISLVVIVVVYLFG
jgi:hypothetical protein